MLSFSLIFTPTMLSESRIYGFRDGFWGEANRFESGVLKELRAWRSTLLRHLPLISTFVRSLLTRFQLRASKSMRKKSRRVKYNDASTRVSAFLVDHGTVKPAFGYSVDF